MPKIKIPTPLRQFTNGTATVSVAGATVGHILKDLVSQFPALEQHMYSNGELRPYVNIFLHNEDVRYQNGLETAVGEDDELLIIPSIAGG